VVGPRVPRLKQQAAGARRGRTQYEHEVLGDYKRRINRGERAIEIAAESVDCDR